MLRKICSAHAIVSIFVDIAKFLKQTRSLKKEYDTTLFIYTVFKTKVMEYVSFKAVVYHFKTGTHSFKPFTSENQDLIFKLKRTRQIIEYQFHSECTKLILYTKKIHILFFLATFS